jgi:GT2 family glycosyltransferase
VDASIVIPLQGAPEQALRCFEALARLPDHPAHEMIVVDNASVGLERLLARLGGDVTVVVSPARAGFAAAANLGAQRATGDAIVLLRGAPQVASEWLEPLVDALRKPDIRAAASVTAGAPAAHPVAAHAVAVRAADFRRMGGVPAAPDGLEVAALYTALLSTAPGRVEAVGASVVTPPGARMGSARRAPGETPELTIVIPTLDAGSDRVRRCLAAAQSTTEAAYDIVLVDNGAPPQGFTAPVNAGLRAARGAYAVVLNDDVELLPGWWPPLRDALDEGAHVAFPLTVEGPMRRDFAAWCFAVSREAIERFGHSRDEFFDPRFCVWFQDADLLHLLRAAGSPPVLVQASRIRHGSSETVMSDDPALRAWIERAIDRDHEEFQLKWGSGAPVRASGAALGGGPVDRSSSHASVPTDRHDARRPSAVS